MQRPIFDHHIVNVVYTMDVGTALNLWAIYRCTKNCEYNPNRFAALKLRFRLQGCAPTFLIFPTGKMVCVGCHSISLAARSLTFLCQHLKECGFTFPHEVRRVRNIVSHVNTNQQVRLDHIASHFPVQCSYEPELFPGLTYKHRYEGKDLTINIFSSGKAVITGCTNEHQIRACKQVLTRILPKGLP